MLISVSIVLRNICSFLPSFLSALFLTSCITDRPSAPRADYTSHSSYNDVVLKYWSAMYAAEGNYSLFFLSFFFYSIFLQSRYQWLCEAFLRIFLSRFLSIQVCSARCRCAGWGNYLSQFSYIHQRVEV